METLPKNNKSHSLLTLGSIYLLTVQKLAVAKVYYRLTKSLVFGVSKLKSDFSY